MQYVRLSSINCFLLSIYIRHDNCLIDVAHAGRIGSPNGSGDYTATRIVNQNLTLTNNSWFILARNNNNSGWSGDVFKNCSADAGACTVIFRDGSVLVVDTQVAGTAVPLPSAFWLCGAGLPGVVGTARRNAA
jgi:hypothetical protein